MTLPPITYTRIPDDAEPGLCYMCSPLHAAVWRSTPTHSLSLCDKVLRRLVKEGKAVYDRSPDDLPSIP